MRIGIVVFVLMAATVFLPKVRAGNMDVPGLSDTVSIISLNAMAKKLLEKENFDSSLIYSTRAVNLADSLLRLTTVKSNQTLLNRCKILKAESLTNVAVGLILSKPNFALDTLQSALKLAKETGDKNMEALINAAFGDTFSSLSKDKKALDYYLRSVALLRETGNQSALAEQLTNAGISQRILGNYGDAMEYLMESLKISRSIGDSHNTIEALLAIGFTYAFVERWDDALKFQQQALEIYRKQNDSSGIARIYNDMGVTNMNAGKLEMALAQHRQALAIRLKSSEKYYTFASYLYIGEILEQLNRVPEAIESYEQALNFTQYSAFKISEIDGEISLGKAYLKLRDYSQALNTLTSAYNKALEIKDMPTQAEASLYIAKVYLAQENPSLALSWLRKAEKAASGSSLVYLADIYQSIAETYFKLNDFRNAYLNQQKYSMVKDSLAVSENLEKIATLSKRLDFENKQALQNQEHEKKLILSQANIRREKIIRNFSLSGMLLALVLMVVAFIRYREKQRLNKKLSETLINLKTTQSQLIQSERMASLGELAAGISHEIQNPLNFVNNFSEMSRELIEEAKQELSQGNQQIAKEILNDVAENLEKINHHGKRADSIIKGMLQHSRSSPGAKVPTDLNALADEFLRLAFHGLRARDKSFNATMETDFDPKLGKVNVVQQDMGRVILNLITNAFYAVNEKRISGAENYQPLVKVSTRQTNDKIMVLVYDNGKGIPQQALEKIFQPFFTTKPAGEGTGLGLSMSYDIITKGHGGELKVKTSPEKGTTFTIVLPV